MNSDSVYHNLNPVQKEAARHFYGPSLILAGAGSGKTRVIVHRIAGLILEKQISPENILAVTFTNKAAKEMKERTSRLLREAGTSMGYNPWIGTFHSVCAQILRTHLYLLPERSVFTIYDSGEQLQLIKRILKDLNINEKMHPAKNFREHINLCKRSAIAPHELDRMSFLAHDKRFFEVYQTYEKALVQLSAFDFESLLFETYKLMRKDRNFLKDLSRRFQFLFVDEYQDINHIQYLLIKKLGEEHKNVCVVGDEDQSIYGWRGADISHILNFERDFKECRIFFLEHNYRSTQTIVSAAGSVISHNQKRKGKKLFTENQGGEKILIKETLNEFEESHFISQRLKWLCQRSKDLNWEDFCILYRTNAQSRSLEDGLRSQHIPYKIVGNVRFYDRAEIKDSVSYLRLILNPHDDVSFLRVINVPRRGMGKANLQILSEQAKLKSVSFYTALNQALQSGFIKGKSAFEMGRFVQCLNDLKNQSDTLSLYDFYILMLDRTGYMSFLKKENTVDAASRVENLQELGNVISRRDSAKANMALPSFLEEMSLLSESDKTRNIKNAVTLMTLHNSKGLEFPFVVIAGLEEGLFPSFKSIEEEELEEERRLAYVGLTRAKVALILTYARSRTVWGKGRYNNPSRFLKEIPQHLTDFQGTF